MKEINRYIKYLFPVIIIVCCYYIFCCYIKSPITTVILVRHADRNAGIDSLNANGQIRAQELARILDETNITAIYVSTANRTQETAQPIAAQLGIAVSIYDTSNLQNLVDDIKNNHNGEVVLVVGHGNTVPATIGLLDISPVPPNIPGSEFDHMYMVTFNSKSIPKMLKMEYGADTP